MIKQGGQTTISTDSLLVEIVHVLEAHGIDQETYTLHDYIDPDALARVVASADGTFEVRLPIEGVRLSITQDGVHALE